VLHRAVREELGTFLAELEQSGALPLPRYVREALRGHLWCGVLAHGFTRLHCDARGHARVGSAMARDSRSHARHPTGFGWRSQRCPACPDQVPERLRHFASRSAMDIDAMGESLVDQVVDKLGVRAPHELFRLTKEQLAGLDRMGDRSTDNVVQALGRAKGRGLARVLVGLAIRHVGTSMAEDLARHFGSASAQTSHQHRDAPQKPPK